MGKVKGTCDYCHEVEEVCKVCKGCSAELESGLGSTALNMQHKNDELVARIEELNKLNDLRKEWITLLSQRIHGRITDEKMEEHLEQCRNVRLGIQEFDTNILTKK